MTDLPIFEQIPSFDARTHRKAATHQPDIEEPEYGRKRRVWEIEPIPYDDLRAGAYPHVGDQLDAVMKGFRALLDAGGNLPPDTVAWVEACEAVKAAHPKP